MVVGADTQRRKLRLKEGRVQVCISKCHSQLKLSIRYTVNTFLGLRKRVENLAVHGGLKMVVE